jgi:hypothetical protein
MLYVNSANGLSYLISLDIHSVLDILDLNEDPRTVQRKQFVDDFAAVA